MAASEDGELSFDTPKTERIVAKTIWKFCPLFLTALSALDAKTKQA